MLDCCTHHTYIKRAAYYSSPKSVTAERHSHGEQVERSPPARRGAPPSKPVIRNSPRSFSCTSFASSTRWSQAATMRSDTTISRMCDARDARSMVAQRAMVLRAACARIRNDASEGAVGEWLGGEAAVDAGGSGKPLLPPASLCTHAIGSFRRSSSHACCPRAGPSVGWKHLNYVAISTAFVLWHCQNILQRITVKGISSHATELSAGASGRSLLERTCLKAF